MQAIVNSQGVNMGSICKIQPAIEAPCFVFLNIQMVLMYIGGYIYMKRYGPIYISHRPVPFAFLPFAVFAC